jgi:membrane dipeptidase
MTAGALTFRTRSAWAAEELDPRVAGIVGKTIGIDTHNHIDLPLTADAMSGPDIDLAGEMKRSGLSAICATFATDYQKGDSYERYTNWFASMDRQLERNGMKRSLTAQDIRVAHRDGKPAVIQSIEGGHFLEGKIERVEEAYHRGLRNLGLLHDSDATVPLGDVYTNPPRYGGLTPFGTSVVRECNRLGILVDLEHADLKTTADAIKISSRPIVCSHTGLDTRLGNDPRMAQMMRPRLISKEQAKLVAKAGGVIGVWVHLSDTALAYAQNVRALVDVVGVDHVCLGTDTKLTQPGARPGQQDTFRPGQHDSRPGERTNLAWADETSGFYYTVVDAMLKTGFTPDEIGKIGGGNYLRVFAAAVS